MRKEEFFDILGSLESDIVEEAEKPVKKKINWKICGATAACLVLIFAVGTAALHRQRDRGIATGPVTADAAPMVYVNDTLYIQSSDQQGYPEAKDDFIYLGQITSDVTNDQTGSNDGTPKENFQANDPIVGCEVYQYGENIVVKINGAYWLYMKYGGKEVSLDRLSELEKQQADPSYHANTTTEHDVTKSTLEAEVLDVTDHTLIVKPSEEAQARGFAQRISIDTANLAELDTVMYIENAQAGDQIAIGYLKEDSDIGRGELAVYEIIPINE